MTRARAGGKNAGAEAPATRTSTGGARLRVLTGTHTGTVFPLAGWPVSVGRDTGAHLRFDPERDLDVSRNHARFFVRDGRWLVRDDGSRNGTFVNGERIEDDVVLSNGDVIEFGGSAASVRFEDDPSRSAPAARRGVRRLLLIGVPLLVLGLLVAASVLQRGADRRSAWARERAVLEARIDSLLRSSDDAVRSLEGERRELAEALEQSQREVRTARGALLEAGARGDTDTLQLRRQLDEATVALTRQQLAASVDARAIERASGAAVALLYVESADGRVTTGTAFAVRPDGTLLTAKHVVAGPDGTAVPRRLGAQFAYSTQVWPARVLALSPSADLAILQAENIQGDVPTIPVPVAGAGPAEGSPVAIIGFPLAGRDLDEEGRAPAVRPLVSVGVVTAAAPNRLEIQGYGAAGASGSPVFDAEGVLIGVLYGGRREAVGQVIFAVAAAKVFDLLEGR